MPHPDSIKALVVDFVCTFFFFVFAGGGSAMAAGTLTHIRTITYSLFILKHLC